jgi:Ca2+-binding EF-hand superfamily protein
VARKVIVIFALPCLLLLPQRLFLRRVAETFTGGELQDLRAQFALMDRDGSGTISYNELVDAVKAMKTGEGKTAVRYF